MGGFVDPAEAALTDKAIKVDEVIIDLFGIGSLGSWMAVGRPDLRFYKCLHLKNN